MPLSINVGLSRKSSIDYQSKGQSINLTAELDSALLTKPAELQQQIAALYAQAEAALDQAANPGAPVSPPPARRAKAKTTSNATVNGNGNGHQNAVTASRFNGETNGAVVNGHQNGHAIDHTNGEANGNREPLLTASQRRAIISIAQRHKIDAQTECLDEYGCPIEELSIKQASSFIEGLLQLSAAGNGRIGAR